MLPSYGVVNDEPAHEGSGKNFVVYPSCLFRQFLFGTKMKMNHKTVASVNSVLFLLGCSVLAAIASHNYKMSDLLINQLDLQIFLRIPEYYSEAFVGNPSNALDKVIDFLVFEQAPFRLIHNRAKPKRPPIVSHAIRHVKNQRV